MAAERGARTLTHAFSAFCTAGILLACAESAELSDGFDAGGDASGGTGASGTGGGAATGGFAFGGSAGSDAAAGTGGVAAGGSGGIGGSSGTGAVGGGSGTGAVGGSSGGTGGTSGSGGTGGGGGTGALDPNLSLPNPAGQPCNTPGYGTGCPSLQVCRISGPNQGTCETCTQCGNLGAFCSSSSQCDILFQCYLGKCTNICPLGTSYCGPPQDCINVGHATHGVCKP